MLNKITIGITQALNAEFGDSIEIYIDDMEQGIDEPCFLVTPRTTIENLLIGKRYERNYPFVIQYFPESKDYRTECNNVTEQLFNSLEIITADGDLIRGSDMTAHIDDGVLNFEVTYKLHVFKKRTSTDEEVMENLKQDISVKE